MMKNQTSQSPEATRTDAESEDWNALSARIQKLAHRRSRSLLGDHDDDAFDRGARSLRTLMSAAEVATRMKREEAKERETDDGRASGQGFTEADIEAAYRKIYSTVERIEREDAGEGSGNSAQGDACVSEGACRAGADDVGAERS